MNFGKWAAIACLAFTFSNGSVQAQQESIPDSELNDANVQTYKELRSRLDRNNRELEAAFGRLDTIVILDTGEIKVTLHQIALRKLDVRMSAVRKQLMEAEETVEFIKNATEQGIEPGEVAWTLQQAERPADSLVDDEDANATDVIDRHRALSQWRAQRLNVSLRESAEQYAYFSEKADMLQKVADACIDLQKESKAIKKALFNAQILEAQLPADPSDAKRIGYIESRYRSILKNYAEFMEENKSVETPAVMTGGPDAAALLTLRGLKIVDLNNQLTAMQEELSEARGNLGYVTSVLGGNGETPALALWILMQQQVLHPVSGPQNKLSTQEILEHLQVKLKKDVAALNSQVEARSEEYVYVYQKANQFQNWRFRKSRQLEDVEIIGEYLSKQRRAEIESEAGVSLPRNAGPMSEQQAEALKSILLKLFGEANGKVDAQNVEPPHIPSPTNDARPALSNTRYFMEGLIKALETELADPNTDALRREVLNSMLEDFKSRLDSLEEQE